MLGPFLIMAKDAIWGQCHSNDSLDRAKAKYTEALGVAAANTKCLSSKGVSQPPTLSLKELGSPTIPQKGESLRRVFLG